MNSSITHRSDQKENQLAHCMYFYLCNQFVDSIQTARYSTSAIPQDTCDK